MKNLILLIICILLNFLTAKAQPSNAYVQNILDGGHIPGLNAVVIKDGHWMYQPNWGKADINKNLDIRRENIFMIASISKTIIATAMMQLWQKGAFKLDDNINNYLPFPVNHPSFPGDSITFRMLATHTAAISDNDAVLNTLYTNGDSPISLDTLMRNYFVPGGSYYDKNKNFFYMNQTGAKYSYSNMGSTLLAYVLQRIAGDDFSHYCDTAIFQKLCMENTSYMLAGIRDTSLIVRPYVWNGSSNEDAGLYGYPDYPDGQLRTNITSLARFMTMYMQYGIYNGIRILDSGTVAYMMQRQTSLSATQGLIFDQYKVGSDILWGHTGGDAGVSTAMFFSYPTKTGVIVLANGYGTVANNMLTVLDTLYKYGRGLTPTASDTFASCSYAVGVPVIAAKATINASVHPNPASQTATLSLLSTPNEALNVMMTDVQGRQVNNVYKGTSTGNQQISIDLNDLPGGLYFINIISGNAHTNLKLTIAP